MHWLPRLATRGGEFDLPLAGRTARRLVDAVCATSQTQRRRRWRTALAGDPALAIWAIVRATATGDRNTACLDSLADYLNAGPPEMFLREACHLHVQPATDYGEAAGVALVTARLARRFARDSGSAQDAAYLLGLVHQAPAWLVDAQFPATKTHRPRLAIPAWLHEALGRLEGQSAPLKLTTSLKPAEQCVSQALRLVCSRDPAPWRAAGLDGRRWIGRWRREGRAWRRGQAWLPRLASILERLARLNRLENNFEQALESAKLEAIKELAYGAGHEINNPLANISARAQTLLKDETHPERRRLLASINTQAFRAHEMIADLMLFARPPQPKFTSVELRALVGQVCDELRSQAAEQQTELVVELPPAPLEIAADPTQIAVALRSLCVNSLEALVTGGSVEVKLAATAAEREGASIQVADTGPGIPPEVRPKIFEPYFSGREAGRGLGLGLSKCWGIVALHRGTIEVGDRDGSGAKFTLHLPARQP